MVQLRHRALSFLRPELGNPRGLRHGEVGSTRWLGKHIKHYGPGQQHEISATFSPESAAESGSSSVPAQGGWNIRAPQSTRAVCVSSCQAAHSSSHACCQHLEDLRHERIHLLREAAQGYGTPEGSTTWKSVSYAMPFLVWWRSCGSEPMQPRVHQAHSAGSSHVCLVIGKSSLESTLLGAYRSESGRSGKPKPHKRGGKQAEGVQQRDQGEAKARKPPRIPLLVENPLHRAQQRRETQRLALREGVTYERCERNTHGRLTWIDARQLRSVVWIYAYL